MKSLAILGSTGSIGVNTLRIVQTHPDRFCVKVIAARHNAEALFQQASEFHPELVCLYETEHAAALEKKLKRLKIPLVTGDEGLVEASTYAGVEKVVFAMVGSAGLLPIFAAIRARKSVAVANKEPLVMAGALLMRDARRFGVTILPIDSEHSALWQCLEGRCPESIQRLILTSSGGPFRTRKGTFAKITPREALKHPKWKMGPKITIDSATLMNKGLEVIEAANLFGAPSNRIEVLIHPEAIVHAMVEFVDGSHLAHLGITDMRLPIQYALSYPERLNNHLPTLDLAHLGSLHFDKPNCDRFPCLKLGYEASRMGGTVPAVLNAANEVAVAKFLGHKLAFTGIPGLIEDVMESHQLVKDPTLEEILDADEWAHGQAETCCH
ncbi:MAG: 1-deoxy-D-xylulose-5-phosphate reductoisomerase [Candidatus Omnitrophica bacterium]|nr:1-deoxy-D-xylulose-5-phosphate reductoisomerase [Candidatus Omnitrophota bacterium]MDD5671237.1 1-deoxy-D-xylulose-5-phosphate reductoisomerase [Candidatus Omnitrophota bacterium]